MRNLRTPRTDREPVAGRRGAAPDERGASLILALVLLLVGVVVVGALANEVSNDLSNTRVFASARSLQYAARSAANLAIENIRYAPLLTASTSAPDTLNASPPTPCWGSAAAASTVANVDGNSMTAWCSTAWSPTSASTRTVTISTCVSTLSAAQCAATPFLEAVVTFDDYPPGVSPPTNGSCQTYCGDRMLIDNWLWSPVVPTVVGISPASGTSAGGSTVTVTGTGFTPGSTVSFVEATGSSPAPDNIVLPATNVTVHGTTSITATTPPVIEGTTYFVTVTTPGGTSALAQSGGVYSFTPVAPSISAISPPGSLSSAGGTLLTISGAGFTSTAQVTFTPEGGGTAYKSAYVTVASPSTLTAVAPAVTALGPYYLTLKTTSGTTAQSASSAVTYVYVVPTVSGVSPNAGPNAGGTVVTISGTGFLNGATVTFYKESGGCQGFGGIDVPSVTVVNATTITVPSPPVTQAQPYYVDVTTSGGGSTYSANCYPIYTYTG